MELTLTAKTAETADTITFKFKPDKELTWKPGQFFRYILPHEDADDRGPNRFFTCAAAPSEGFIQITTRFAGDKGSSFKKHLFKMELGDIIKSTGPSGEFVLEDIEKEYIFIAGGIGITPFRSMLKEADLTGQMLKVTLLYGSKSEDNIPFKEELEQFSQKNPNLKIHYVIDPQRIDAQVIQLAMNNYQLPIIYVSGPEPMVEAIEKTLAELGIEKDHIKQDYFPGYES